MPTSSRRFAVVGTGHRAELFVEALLGSHRDAGELVAWCDPNPARMAYYENLRREALGDAAAEPLPAFSPLQFEELVHRTRPDVVLVTTVDRWHAHYIAKALELGCDVITEKPLTVDAAGCRVILGAVAAHPGSLTVTFNYRYSPRNSALKRLILDGAVGTVTSISFEWLLDTRHGADYFRRWHRDKTNSGGLLVHKAGHHFDLASWWLDDRPRDVFAFGSLAFYGAEAAGRRGLAPRPGRSHGHLEGNDPFALDLAADPRLRALYLDAEVHDGYHRDQDVFSDGVTIEDNLAVTVRYRRGALLSYSLNAHSPWEGYRVGVNGTEGRLELAVVERAEVVPDVFSVDPTYASGVDGGADGEPPGPVGPPAREAGSRLVLQRHWEPAREIDIDALARGDEHRPPRGGGHGGGDLLLLDDVLYGPERIGPDPLGRAAGVLDGVRSVLIGAAANLSIASGTPCAMGDFGLPLGPDPRTGREPLQPTSQGATSR